MFLKSYLNTYIDSNFLGGRPIGIYKSINVPKMSQLRTFPNYKIETRAIKN